MITTLCARIISTCHLRRQSQATSSRAVLRGALHRIACGCSDGSHGPVGP
jgi:hypothetical protein